MKKNVRGRERTSLRNRKPRWFCVAHTFSKNYSPTSEPGLNNFAHPSITIFLCVITCLKYGNPWFSFLYLLPPPLPWPWGCPVRAEGGVWRVRCIPPMRSMAGSKCSVNICSMNNWRWKSGRWGWRRRQGQMALDIRTVYSHFPSSPQCSIGNAFMVFTSPITKHSASETFALRVERSSCDKQDQQRHTGLYPLKELAFKHPAHSHHYSYSY